MNETIAAKLAERRRRLYEAPELRYLFLELTLDCNEYCKHCGSRCGDIAPQELLTAEEYLRILDEVKADLGTEGFMLCITGGEPLLRKDFFTIMGYAHKLGFSWGMTSNGTLIDRDTAHRLRNAGMKTISVSIDGTEHTHDSFRRVKGAYRKAISGINALIEEGGFNCIQVTSVITHESIGELETMLTELDALDIDSWRIVGIEPIGRAKQYPELLLTPEDHKRLFTFIEEKRQEDYPITYGCSHYLGEELETQLKVRDWHFICGAGIYVASISANGDISACLDIERRPELVQGNIRKDRFSEVWQCRFKPFRDPSFRTCEQCRACPDLSLCAADSFHTWNFDESRPELCFREMFKRGGSAP